MVNGKVAKAGTTIKVGDEIEIVFGNRNVKVKVDSIAETVKKDDAKEMYTPL